MKVETTALVKYTCFLDEEQAIEVIKYAKEHDCDLEEAVLAMYEDYEMDFELYHDSTESDFSTESIDFVELDENEQELYDEIMESDNEA